ncbi:MAG: HupE/UreJ family protein, partial [Gemmatimonadota bacterium]
AHEIPPSVIVRTFVRPDGNVLRVLVRVPLNSMRDFAWPVTGPGYVLISDAESMLPEAARLWIVDYIRLYEEGVLLGDAQVTASRISLPSDASFGSYESALAHFQDPILANEIELYWEQALLDVLIEYPIASDRSRFALDSELAHLGLATTTILRFQLPDRPERLFQFTGMPGLIQLDPQWYQAALRFVRLGFLHILDGIDHLLFVLCLVIPFRRMVPLLAVITAFTVAHSITLIASALGFAPNSLWFPPIIEFLIALSIVFMAFENIVGANLRRRWLVAFLFGLVHGFGFSFALRESLQYAGAHLTTSLLSFNVGVELGQIAVLVVLVPSLRFLFSRVVAERMGVILLSALVAHTAWHWMADRWGALRDFPLVWPTFNALFLAAAMRWMMGVLILVGLLWGMYAVFGRFTGLREEKSPEAEEV